MKAVVGRSGANGGCSNWHLVRLQMLHGKRRGILYEKPWFNSFVCKSDGRRRECFTCDDIMRRSSQLSFSSPERRPSLYACVGIILLQTSQRGVSELVCGINVSEIRSKYADIWQEQDLSVDSVCWITCLCFCAPSIPVYTIYQLHLLCTAGE